MQVKHSHRAYTGYVETYIGTAYDNVKLVADNIEDINIVALGLDKVEEVLAIAPQLTIVGDNIDEVVIVADNIANVNTTAESIANVNNVGNNIADVVTAGQNIPAITDFDARYYGPLAIEPSTRIDGTASQKGDMYFNTATDIMEVWTGIQWAYAGVETVDTESDLSTVNKDKGQMVFTKGKYSPFDGLGALWLHNIALDGTGNGETIIDGWVLQIKYDIHSDLERIAGIYKLGNGLYAADEIKTFTATDQYVFLGKNIYIPLNAGVLPYTIDPTLYPDPTTDPNLQNWLFSVSGGTGEVTINDEAQVLISGQVTVTFLKDVSIARFTLHGSDMDSTNLFLNDQFTLFNPNTIVLNESYPAGTVITATNLTL